MDGVLVDSRDTHYEALNRALNDIDEKYVIDYDEHIAKYDGNSTTTKLKMLTETKGLPTNLHGKVWELKQKHTLSVLNEYCNDERINSILKELKSMGYLLYCASNSIWITMKTILLRKGFLEYFDYFISNEDVKDHKPNPDIYLNCVNRANISPRECMILEDSPIGKEAAIASGCYLCPIENSDDLTLDKILKHVKFYENQNKLYEVSNEWIGNINIVIPMAGRGSRFSSAGYVFPKPLIEVNDKPMIQLVIENINIKGNYIFIVQREHYEEYCLKYLLNLIAPNCKIICVDEVTEGAACTILLADKYIDNETPLLLANSDQYLEWNSSSFLYSMMSNGIDGGISTFRNTHPRWSYVKLDKSGYVSEVKEKEVISEYATTGIYFWRKGSDFVKYAKQMIDKNVRVNNEFYVAPVYNEAIQDDKKFKIKDCDKMWGLGIPEDLNHFLTNYDKS